MDERGTGLILRTYPLTETSLIVHWLSPQFGRVATAAKGARRPRSNFRGKLDLFYRCDFSFARSRRSTLHTLREVTLREPHAWLREDLGRLRQATYAAGLIEQHTEAETPLPRLYEMLESLLRALATGPPQALTVHAFEMKLLVELGVGPDLATAGLSAGARQILTRCAEADWIELRPLRPSPAQDAEINRYLHGFLIFHLGRVPPGRHEALEGSA